MSSASFHFTTAVSGATDIQRESESCVRYRPLMHPNKEGWVDQFDVILPCRTIFRLQRNFPRIFSWKSTLSNNILKCCSENPWICGAICIKRMVRVTLIQCERERDGSRSPQPVRENDDISMLIGRSTLMCSYAFTAWECIVSDETMACESREYRVKNYLSGLVWENWNNPRVPSQGDCHLQWVLVFSIEA